VRIVILKKVAETIKTMRKSRGLTQREFAERLGVSHSTVAMWETAKREPDFESMEAIADLFNVPYASIAGGDLSSESRQAQMKKVPLLGSVAAGEPINDAEFPDTYVYSPVDCDFAIRVKGSSMQPTYLEGDVVYCRSCRALPHDGAIVVLSIGVGECVEHCIKHVVQTDAGVVIMSDNPEYPARLIAPDQQPTVLGIPVGYTRIYGQ
jgi:repressor LexA